MNTLSLAPTEFTLLLQDCSRYTSWTTWYGGVSASVVLGPAIENPAPSTTHTSLLCRAPLHQVSHFLEECLTRNGTVDVSTRIRILFKDRDRRTFLDQAQRLSHFSPRSGATEPTGIGRSRFFVT
jgi:hypothetical protein